MEGQKWIKQALIPFSWLYGCIMRLRNFLYDYQIFISEKPPQFVICIGNLTVGGTGKTPLVEYLIRLLASNSNVAVLSRGYGRKTKGFVLADDLVTAAEIGDEPYQYFTKYKEKIAVAVCENRVRGALLLNERKPAKNILLLDDAFQHRAILQNVKLLLNDYNRPFYHDRPFPSGLLREGRSGARRADAIIVMKCPEHLNNVEKDLINRCIGKYSRPGTPVFYSCMDYSHALSYSGQPISLKNVKLVAGIANPAPFRIFLSSQFNVIEEVIYPDHHNYSADDLEQLIKYLKNDTFVVTTEKDMVKLKPLVEKAGLASTFAYIPITVNFGNDTERFNAWITDQVQNLS